MTARLGPERDSSSKSPPPAVVSPRVVVDPADDELSSKDSGSDPGISAAAVVAAVARFHQLQQHYVAAAAAAAASALQEPVDSSLSSPSSPCCTTPSPGPKNSGLIGADCGRRANKPLMEKRRRARINQSLAALKALILDSARLENTKHSKLEKADILELTVRHLQRQRSLAQPGLSRYKAGYQDCSREVSRYLDAPEIITGNTTPIDPAVKQRLIRHLDSCVSELDLDLGSRPDSGLGSSPGSVSEHRVLGGACASPGPEKVAAVKQETPSEAEPPIVRSSAPGDENNNRSRDANGLLPHHLGLENPPPGEPGQSNSNMLSVVQVIPSRLPDGQVVFLLPSHYVQLAAAAAANGISIGPNPPTAIWATTNMSLLGSAAPGTEKLLQHAGQVTKRLCPEDWSAEPELVKCSSGKNPRIELAEQPLDFTTSTSTTSTSSSGASAGGAKKIVAKRYLEQQPGGSKEVDRTTTVVDQSRVKDQDDGACWRPW